MSSPTRTPDPSSPGALETIARLHPWLIAVDPTGRAAWISDALRELYDESGRRLGCPLPELLSLDGECIDALSPGAARLGGARVRRAEIRHRTPVPVDAWALLLPEADAGVLLVLRPRVLDGAASRRAGGAGDDDLVRAIVESAPDGVLALDAHGFVTYANRAARRLLGFPAVELDGRPVIALAGDALDVAAELARAGPPSDRPIELRDAAGRPRFVSISSGPLATASGPFDGFRAGLHAGRVAVVRDATARHRREVELSKRADELEHYVDAVSHDLRSPLSALRGFAGLLREVCERSLDEDARRFLERIEQSSHTMEMLIEDLLVIARGGCATATPGPVSSRSVLARIAAELKPRLDAQGVELVLPDSPPAVHCHRVHLYQVFANLIGNALDHMGPCRDPRIEVAITEEPDAHTIHVRDNGRGIDPSQHGPIGLGDGRDEARAGLGLSIVRRIADATGGRLWMDGRPGEGAAFHLRLPRPSA